MRLRLALLGLLLRYLFLMAVTPKQGTVTGSIKDIIKRLQDVERANPLATGATISSGGLTFIDPNTGNVTGQIGLGGFNDGSGRTQMRTAFYRADGSLAFIIADLGSVPGHTFAQALQLFDRLGNIWAADDTTSGQGIAKPYIPIGFFTDNTVPTSTTTSTSFTTLQTLVGYKQHPKVIMQVLVYADSGTTGVIQVVDQAGNVLGSTTLTSGQFGYVTFGPVALAGAHELAVSLNIQGKVTSGAGKVGARGVSAHGVQS